MFKIQIKLSKITSKAGCDEFTFLFYTEISTFALTVAVLKSETHSKLDEVRFNRKVTG